MKTVLIVAAVLSLSAVPGYARGYLKSQLDVNPTSQTTFEVIEDNGAGPNQIWCAAADYSTSQLRMPSGRLYISTPRGPSVTEPGKKGVSFSTQPLDGVSGRATNSIKEVGANLRVGHAIQFCRDNILSPDDR